MRRPFVRATALAGAVALLAQLVLFAPQGASAQTALANGMLVLANGGDGRVYAIEGGKRRWIVSGEAFAQHGFSWAKLVRVSLAALIALPEGEPLRAEDTRVRFVRVAGSHRVYVVSEAGYRRYVQTPAALASYGAANIAQITQAEFERLPETQLVALRGSDKVYSTLTRRLVGLRSELAALGHAPASVHAVTAADFASYAAQVVARELAVPWDVAVLPGGDLLVTERRGTLRRIGAAPATITLPSVLHSGEGGLMGLALHPDFVTNQFVYLYFTTTDEKNRVSRFRLDGAALVDEKIIVDGIPSALYHDGGQLAFGPDGMLYVTTGDAEQPALAQHVLFLAGKTLRYTADGGIPADNPFPDNPVWSSGHRNVQGMAWDSQGRLWQVEHGRSGAASGYDEINLIEKGKNYGWPAIQGDQKAEGLVAPVRHSGATTTWAPSGAAFTNGKLYFAGLKGEALYEARPTAAGGITDFAARLHKTYGRLRAVTLGPDGALYVTTSNRDGRGTPRAGDDLVIRVFPEMLGEGK